MPSDIDLRELAVRRDEPDQQVGPRRHLISRYLVPAALILGFLTVLGWAVRDAFLPRRPVTVMPVLVSQSAIQQQGTPLFKAAGWVEPRPTPIRVPSLTAGYVEELLVREDQAVKAGDPVAYLVDDDARLMLESAQASLNLRQAELDESQAMLEAAKTNFTFPLQLQAAAAKAEADLAKIETQIEIVPVQIQGAEARLKVAREDLKGKTRSGKFVSGIAVDKANSELEAAAAAVRELRERLPLLQRERQALAERRDALRKQLELKTEETRAFAQSQAKLKAARARVEQARVAVAEAQLRLDRMTVRSPVAGRVLHLLAHPGTHVMAMGHQKQFDTTTVVTLYQADKLQVRVDVRFADLPQAHLGQPALIESPAVTQPLEGKVLFPTSLADIQKNTLEVKVEILSPPPVLKPEMLVDVTFLAPAKADDEPAASDQLRLFIPHQLIDNVQDEAIVWVADLAAGVARRQRVKTGSVRSKTLVEIVDGLTPASRLIVGGRSGLRDGERIQVTAEDTNLGVGIDASK